MPKPIPRPPGDSPDTDSEGTDDRIIGRAFFWSLVVLGVGVLVAAGGGGIYALVSWINRPAAPIEGPALVLPTERDRPEVELPHIEFDDQTVESGIDFVHFNGGYGEKLLPETMGGGVAVFDFDNDGDQDLLFINGAPWPGRPDPAEGPPTMRLYKNDGTGRFEDATRGCGLDRTFYGQGVAVGDYDNDGWVDVFISAVGPNHLFKNEQGTFRDVTDEAGVAGDAAEWSTGCGFFDLENDGDLDLFVCNYVRWTKEIDLAQGFQLVGVGRAFGPPTQFEGTFPYLYRNDGGRFTDVSADSGVQVKHTETGAARGKSLGIAPVDLEFDGHIDLIVANDTVPNFVFRNKGDGTMEEIGAEVGIAYDSSGNARGAMGADTGHFRNDATLAVAIGNFALEMTGFYVSQGQPLAFADDAVATGLGPPTRLGLTFGLFFFDYDLDGRLDLFEANGHLEEEINKVQESQHYAQSPKLFWNCGQETATEFLPVSAEQGGKDLATPIVGRGAAYGDFDGDGDLDIVITSTGAPPRLLRNMQVLSNHWLRLKLTGTSSNRDAIGAWVEVHRGDQVLRRQVMPTKSYLSQCELPVTFGLGDSEQIDKLIVRWPDGTIQPVAVPGVDRTIEVEQSTGDLTEEG